MNITPAELGAMVKEAHAHGIKVTGHLCSIGFREAAALGVDDLEHGLVVDTEFSLPNTSIPSLARSTPRFSNE